jgi:hypothetical protein
MKSDRYEVLKISELIRNYINYPESGAGIQLGNRIIKGEDLVSALDNLGFETDEEIEDYEKTKSDYENLEIKYNKLEEDLKINNPNLINDLETLIKGKEGEFTNEIRTILDGLGKK